MSSTFSSPFMSLSGQAERLGNAFRVVSTVVNPFSSTKIKTNTPIPIVNKATSSVLNSGVTRTALGVGAVVGGYNVAKSVGAAATSAGIFSGASKVEMATSSAASSAGVLSTGGKLALAGLLGFGAGNLLSGRGSSQDQTMSTEPSLSSSQAPQTSQGTFQNPDISPKQRGGIFDLTGAQTGRDVRLSYSQSQDTYTWYNAYAEPSQYVPVSQTPTQYVEPKQDQEATTETNWGTILLVGVGVYLLIKSDIL